MNQIAMFVLLCGVMVLLALAVVLYPLYRERKQPTAGTTNTTSIMLLMSVLVLMLSAGMYVQFSKGAWNVPESAQVNAAQAADADVQAEITAFEARVNTNAEDVEGWMLLGSARIRARDFAGATQAYDKAFTLTQGSNMDARTGLAESLILADTTTLNGRAALLINEGLQQAPMHPKLLWYGGLVAMQANDLQLARTRFQSLLQLNPPDNVRELLGKQIDQINVQLGESTSGTTGAMAATSVSDRAITVHVTLSAAMKQKLTQPMTLFILARNPAQPGPPLAVERHQSSELPLTVELTTADAMLPSRTLAAAQDVEVVARLSSSGTPMEQSGDLTGIARYSFAKGERGEVSIEINRQVP